MPTVQKTQSRRPFVILLIAMIFSAHAFIIPFIAIYFVFADSNSTFIYNGEVARIGDHRFDMFAGLLAWWLFAFAIAYGYWRRFSWSRHIIPAIHVFAVVTILITDPSPELLFIVLYVALILWYFYGKASVNEYFGGALRMK